MKKYIAGLFLIATAIVMADSWTVNVSTNSVMVAPPRGNELRTAASEWASSTNVAQGAVFVTTTGFYWAIEAGASTNAPTHTAGTVGILRYVPSKEREFTAVSCDDTVYVNYNAAASTSTSKLLGDTGVVILGEDQQKALYAVAASGTNTVRVIDFD